MSKNISIHTIRKIQAEFDSAIALCIGDHKPKKLSAVADDLYPGRAMVVLAPGTIYLEIGNNASDIALCLYLLGRIPEGIKCIMCIDTEMPRKFAFGKELLKDNRNILYSYDKSIPSLVPHDEFKILGDTKKHLPPPALYYMGEMTEELEERYAREQMMRSYGNAYGEVQTILKTLGACPQITLSMKDHYNTERIALHMLSFGKIDAMAAEVEKYSGFPSMRPYLLPENVRLEENRPVAECYREQVENTVKLHKDFVNIARGIATIWSRRLKECGLSISFDYNELEPDCDIYRNLQKHGYMIGIDQDVRALLAGVPLQDILV